MRPERAFLSRYLMAFLTGADRSGMERGWDASEGEDILKCTVLFEWHAEDPCALWSRPGA